MTERDVLITKVGDPLTTSSPDPTREPVEQLWAVSAEGHQPLTVHPFTEALDVALTWASESGGEIYRRDRPGHEAALYKAAW